jgi:hypothetical protein
MVNGTLGHHWRLLFSSTGLDVKHLWTCTTLNYTQPTTQILHYRSRYTHDTTVFCQLTHTALVWYPFGPAGDIMQLVWSCDNLPAAVSNGGPAKLTIA